MARIKLNRLHRHKAWPAIKCFCRMARYGCSGSLEDVGKFLVEKYSRQIAELPELVDALLACWRNNDDINFLLMIFDVPSFNMAEVDALDDEFRQTLLDAGALSVFRGLELYCHQVKAVEQWEKRNGLVLEPDQIKDLLNI